MKLRYAKLKRTVYAEMLNHNMWIEVDPSFKGRIVEEDEDYVIIYNGEVRVRVRNVYVEEIDNI